MVPRDDLQSVLELLKVVFWCLVILPLGLGLLSLGALLMRADGHKALEHG